MNELPNGRVRPQKPPRIDFDLSPFIVIWEATQACDLACVHCRADARPGRDPKELSTEEGFALIDGIKKFGSPLLVFTGGDPLKRDDLYDLISYSVGKGIRTTVSPSVTPLLTRDAFKKFADAGVSRVAISLDGSVPAIHDSFRGIEGTFDATMIAIENCVSEGIALQINTTVTTRNFHCLTDIAFLIKEFGVVLWSVFFLVPTGRGSAEYAVTPQEHEEAFNKMYDLSKIMPYDIKSTEAPHYRRVFIQREVEARRASKSARTSEKSVLEDAIGRSPMGLNDGKGFVFISHTGDVMPSGFLPLPGGNVRDKSIVDIYRDSPLFREIRDYSLLKGKCGVCEFMNVCGGSRARTYALTSDYMESEPYCTYVPKKYEEDSFQGVDESAIA